MAYMGEKKFSHVLTTHKHKDHSGGNVELRQLLGIDIVGGKHDSIPGVSFEVEDK